MVDEESRLMFGGGICNAEDGYNDFKNDSDNFFLYIIKNKPHFIFVFLLMIGGIIFMSTKYPL